MLLSIDPHAAQAAALALQLYLEREILAPERRELLVEALNALRDALDSEAERQHLERSYPEGGF